MSGASIDRCLAPAKAREAILRKTTIKPYPRLRSSITIRKAGDKVDAETGFFEGDTVAHCGLTLKGEFTRTLKPTDVHSGWVVTMSVRKNAHVHIRASLRASVATVPLAVINLDFDSWNESLNYDVVGWASTLGIYFTRSRPYKKNDQVMIESKNNHLVRKYGFDNEYDTRLKYLSPTKKPIGFGCDQDFKDSYSKWRKGKPISSTLLTSPAPCPMCAKESESKYSKPQQFSGHI